MKRNQEPLFLFLGDLIFFYVALWLAVTLRVFFAEGRGVTFVDHLVPFTVIFLIWALVFYIADLYSKRTFVFRHELPARIFRAQLVNSLVAIIFFYFIPYFGITPKTILFLCLLFFWVLILLWRLYVIRTIYRNSRERAILIGEGSDIEALREEVSENPGYNLEIVNKEPLGRPDAKTILGYIRGEGISLIIVDLHDPLLMSLGPDLYKLMSSRVKFVNFETIYEEVFDRVPLSFLKDSWFLEHISLEPKRAYTFLKRLMDVIIAFLLGTVSLVLYPFIALAIKFGSSGPVFLKNQLRVGKEGKIIKLLKFRTMTTDEANVPTKNADPRVTRAGKFLRRTRLDEIPQLWDVVEGKISLVGPRPELPVFVEKYQMEIPYYDVRHIVPPGLSGWAQIHFYTPAYSAATNAVKLSYELYYIKNRSFWLDLKIALKTVRLLLSRKGI